MAVPLLDDERVLGVLQVLDRPQRARFSLQEMELLGMFANQAAIAVVAALRRRGLRAPRSQATRGRCGRRGASRRRSIASKAATREAADALLDGLARVLSR